MLIVAVVSLIAVGVLGLVCLGFRPLVISSGSMQPALRKGDVVFTVDVRADRLRVGDIVTFDDDANRGTLVTHRVRGVVLAGSRIRVETRGDANTVSEIWTVPRDTLLRRTSFEVPSVGGIASAFGSAAVRNVLFASGAVLAAFAAAEMLGRTTRRSRDNAG
jgi:signal peptidase